ncbi:McbB family protein [Pseudomonas sp. X10]
MKSLKICNYEILNFETEPLVYSAKGITKITNPNLASALHKIIKLKETGVAPSLIEEILKEEGVHAQSALQFLKDIAILSNDIPAPYFSKAVIYCDWQISPNTEYLANRQNPIQIEIRDLDKNYKPQEPSPTLFILASLKLDYKETRKKYHALIKNNPTSAISMGFISGGHFHLTEPYIPTIKNPCAFCTIDRIIHYESQRSSHHPWSRVLAFCHNHNLPSPKTEIDEFQNALILGAILKIAKKFTTHQTSKTTQDRVLQSITIELDSGRLVEEPSIHWPLCECLEAH